MTAPAPLPRPRKRFGQHFLHDRQVLSRIVDAFDPRPADHVVEIGPGRGALTERLLKRLTVLTVVEIDRDLASHLGERFGARLAVHPVDALRFDFGALAASGERLRVIGNLPYNISTPLLFHLFDSRDRLADMLFMLQKEVVERLAAPPGGADYGRLSVMAQSKCAIDRLFDVPAAAFTPPPRVESSVVRLRPHRPPAHIIDNPHHFADLVRYAFGQRRKTLRNALRDVMDEAAIRAAQIDPALRAERLSVADFVRLSNHAAPAPRRAAPD